MKTYFHSIAISAKTIDKVLQKTPKILFFGSYLNTIGDFSRAILGRFRSWNTNFGHMEKRMPK